MWNFGSGKTFWTFLECFTADKRNTYIIANVPYSRVDYFYSTPEDLANVFRVLEEYSLKTNHNVQWYAKDIKDLKDILLIVDEAHLYLDSRSSLRKGNNLEWMMLLFTQCRKRRIRIVFITQRLTQIDIIVRRLADYVSEYHRSNFFGLYWVKKTVYENRWDIADIETDTTVKYTNEGEMKNYKEDAKLYSEFFSPLTLWLQFWSFFSSSYKEILKEYYETYYICWQEDVRVGPFNLEILEKGLQKSPELPFKFDRDKNVPTFKKAYDKIFTLVKKVFDKIESLLHTEDDLQDIHSYSLDKEDKVLDKITKNQTYSFKDLYKE